MPLLLFILSLFGVRGLFQSRGANTSKSQSDDQSQSTQSDDEADVAEEDAEDTDDHSDHSGHMDTPPAIPAPGSGADAAEIADFLDDLFAQPEIHVHAMGSGKAMEHDAVMDLMPRSASTHVAIADGDWSDPSTWSGGEVPDDDARVLVPDGVKVTYDTVSDARLFTVRIDGDLEFATDTDSQIIFDTMLVSPTGELVIGTEDDPVEPGVTVDLIVANNGPIDTDWDPQLLSRGLISHGDTTIHGAEKDSHEKVETDPMTGDTFVKFAGVPEGWEVGDKIVIAGTHYDGYKWDSSISATRWYENEDETRTISQIDPDGTIHFDTALEHDHDSPRGDLKTSVANYTRNVSIETEDALSAAVYERGHVMFMHSDNVDVRFAEFSGLGRTDKSVPAKQADEFAEIDFDSNVQGRYALHLHRTGVDDPDNPAILEGNAVWGSPGWGIVHHDSNAVITGNATYDTVGAGYVAETGNETGIWSDNIAIFAKGSSWAAPKNATDLDTFDTARSGDGFWFQGRQVEADDNIAASVNRGFVYFHRNGDDRMIESDASTFDYPDALYNDPTVGAAKIPILHFSGNEAFASNEGLHIVKANPNQGHDVWSHLDDFTAWSVRSGAHLEYTSHYILTDFDVIGKEATTFSTAKDGISLGKNTTDVIINNATVSGFDVGINLLKQFTDASLTDDLHDFVVIDPDISDVNSAYSNYDPALDTILTGASLPSVAASLDLDDLVMGSGKWGGTAITGTKTDALGTAEFPSGTDYFQINNAEQIAHLEEAGYWTTSGGQGYFLLDIYFTDRISGEVYYETHKVDIPDATLSKFGSQYFSWENAQHNGVQDIVDTGSGLMAGDVALNTPVLAISQLEDVSLSPSISSRAESHAMHDDASLPDAAVIWDALTKSLASSADDPALSDEEDAELVLEV